MNNGRDYCTLWFDRLGDYDISGCCLIHDEEYEDPHIPREEADENLRKCVNQVTKSNIGNIMYVGVRAFGWIFRTMYFVSQINRKMRQVFKEQKDYWFHSAEHK